MESRNRKLEKVSKGKARQPTEKKQEVIQAFAVKKTSTGTTACSIPRCNECGFHLNGSCWICTNCGMNGNPTSKCKTTPNWGTAITEGRACFECKEVGEIRKDCPKLKGKGGNSRSRSFVLGAIKSIRDLTVVTGTFLINNFYANTPFDIGTARSYITQEFRKCLNQPSWKLRESYRV